MMRSSRYQRRRLRKQPKVQRFDAKRHLALPSIKVPEDAKKRKRRNDPRIQMPIEVLKNLLLTSRWVSLSLLAMCVWALVLIGGNDSFYLSVIPVRGAKSISDSEIVQASGLEGRHVFAANPQDSASRIKGIPGVKNAAVTLLWPNEVNIEVGEETPVAIWNQRGKNYWINESGQLLPARSVIPGLLVIESEEPRPARSNEFVPEPIIRGALQLKELRPNIDRLFYRPETGLSYQDGRGWRGHFGTGTDMEQKLVVYETIIEELVDIVRPISYISVRNQAKPYYKLEPMS